MKAATQGYAAEICHGWISIHAAREGGDINRTQNGKISSISIHAAREGGDAENLGYDCNQAISIHAAREGGDGRVGVFKALRLHFNPRRP